MAFKFFCVVAALSKECATDPFFQSLPPTCPAECCMSLECEWNPEFPEEGLKPGNQTYI